MSLWLRASNLPVNIKGLGRWFKRDLGLFVSWLEKTTGTGVSATPIFSFDSSNNLYAAWFSAVGNYGINVIKVSKNGVFNWAYRYDLIATPGIFNGQISIKNDSLGNLYISAMDAAIPVMSVIKINSLGGIVWSKNINGITPLNICSVGVDNSNNPAIWFDHSLSAASFLKINAAGTAVLFSKAVNGGAFSIDVAGSIESDSAGNWYLAGRYVPAGFEPYFLKYNSAGVLQWTASNNAGFSVGSKTQITVCSDQSVILSYGDAIANTFIQKFNAAGNTILWEKYNAASSPATTLTQPSGVSVDSLNNAYLQIGYLTGSASLFIKFAAANGATVWGRSTSGKQSGEKTIFIDTDQQMIFGVGLTAASYGAFRLPNNGTLTGVYAGVTYAVNSGFNPWGLSGAIAVNPVFGDANEGLTLAAGDWGQFSSSAISTLTGIA